MSAQPATTDNRAEGRIAVVTGAASGIGRAFALRLAAEGAAIAVVDIADGAETVASITAAGGEAASFVTDVSDEKQIAELVAPIEKALGPVDILVNNAGIYPMTPFPDLTIESWRHVFAINVESMFLTTQAFSPGMKTRRWGRVVNVASNSVALQVPGATHYISSKMAVIGLTRGIATEFGEFGITANAIAPSATRTPGTANMPEDGFAALAQMQSIKRTQVPDDLAGALAFLVSEDAAFVTGQTLYVDGGLVRTS
jgi:3-oxoacyl-[acyl-carrier protein] reductase/(S)-1-phenylethanol dehydrogenase